MTSFCGIYEYEMSKRYTETIWHWLRSWEANFKILSTEEKLKATKNSEYYRINNMHGHQEDVV